MVAHKPTTKVGPQKKTASEADKPKKPTFIKKPKPAKQMKPVKEKSSKPAPSTKASKAPVGGVAIHKPTSGVTRSLLVVQGKGKGIATDERVAQSLLELQQPKGKICDTPSPLDAKTGAEAEMSDSEGDTKILNVGEEKGEDVSNTVALDERTNSNSYLRDILGDILGKDIYRLTKASQILYQGPTKYINENVKEAVQNALKAPVCKRFTELSEFEMNDILRDRMFKSGSYRSQPEHIALYEALEASMDLENRDEFVQETAKSRKRRRDNQDPPLPPSKDSDQNKKKRYDSDTSA
ncbi:hypothetical protein Tco_0321562 [Tanacetum coccineum]